MNNDGGNEADRADRHRNEVIPGSTALIHAQRVSGVGDRVNRGRGSHNWLGLALFLCPDPHR